MQQPLGKAIGNLIEIKDVIDFLSGNVNKYSDIKKLIYKFTIKILSETKKIYLLVWQKKKSILLLNQSEH